MDAITAYATVATAIATILLVVATAFLARLASSQLEILIDNQKRIEESQRIVVTVRACLNYNTDLVFEGACKRIWHQARSGSDDAKPDYKLCNKRDIILVMNFVNNICLGVAQKVYVEEIVEDTLKNAFHDIYKVLVEDGIVSKEEMNIYYPAFEKLHSHWFPKQILYQPAFRAA